MVTVLFCGLYGVELLRPSFTPPPAVGSVMLVMVVWLFATDVRRKRNNDNNHD